MDTYKNKYRVSPARAQWWDYGWDAQYFITICTRDRQCCFGEIQNDIVILSAIGQIAESCWTEIPMHAKNIELGAWVVMPNHVHGILALKGHQAPFVYVNPFQSVKPPRADPPLVETRHALSLPMGMGMGMGMGMETNQTDPNQKQMDDDDPECPPQTVGRLRFQNPGKNTISTIIGGFKSAVSKNAHRLGFDFEWQGRFHDHVIRDEEEYERITQYILKNPAKWKGDKFFKAGETS